jgi:hypothetical protein
MLAQPGAIGVGDEPLLGEAEIVTDGFCLVSPAKGAALAIPYLDGGDSGQRRHGAHCALPRRGVSSLTGVQRV